MMISARVERAHTREAKAAKHFIMSPIRIAQTGGFSSKIPVLLVCDGGSFACSRGGEGKSIGDVGPFARPGRRVHVLCAREGVDPVERVSFRTHSAGYPNAERAGDAWRVGRVGDFN